MATCESMTHTGTERTSRRWPRFADTPSVRSREEADRAHRLADRILQKGYPDPKPNEPELFTALHVCAYRASISFRSDSSMTRSCEHWLDRWAALREYLINENRELVYSTAYKLRAPEAQHDELISEGMYALVRAVDRYNPFRGFSFSTYACNVIARAIIKQKNSGRDLRTH